MQDRDTRAWRARIRWIVNHYETDTDEVARRKNAAKKFNVTIEGLRLLWEGTSKPKRETLVQIALSYPRVNPGWLLTGKGPRERTPPEPERDEYTAGIRAALVAGVRSLVELEERLTGESTMSCSPTVDGKPRQGRDEEFEQVTVTPDDEANVP